MFAVYNDKGLSFRDTLDNLYSLSEIKKISPLRNNVENGLPQSFSINHKQQESKKSSEEEAKLAYKKIANIDIKEPIYHVSKIMTSPVISISSNKSIKEAYELMKEKNIRQIPIIDSTTNVLANILTIRQILKQLNDDINFAKLSMVKSLNTIEPKQIITTDPITDLRRAAKVMLDFNLNALLVINSDDEIKGILSKTDIVRAVANIPDFKVWG